MLYDKSVVPVILRQHGFQDSSLYNLEDTIKIDTCCKPKHAVSFPTHHYKLENG